MDDWQRRAPGPLIGPVDCDALPWPLPEKLTAVAQGLERLPGWAAHGHVCCEGRTILLAEHDGSDQTFVLSEVEGGVELAQAYEDRLERRGTFAEAGTVLAALEGAAPS